jgi:hypothetical protein
MSKNGDYSIMKKWHRSNGLLNIVSEYWDKKIVILPSPQGSKQTKTYK